MLLTGFIMIAIGLVMMVLGFIGPIINPHGPEQAKQVGLGIGGMFIAGGIIVALFIGK
jgi:hypothetical protein